jgi:hypothetical protein
VIAMKWAEIHPQVKKLLLDPMNQPAKYNEDMFDCGCSQDKVSSRDLWVLMCSYHHGYNDALNTSTAFLEIGAGR